MYSKVEDIKSMLDITTSDYDVQIAECIRDADVWVDSQLSTFNVPMSTKRTLSRLYASYLFRSSKFETYTESESNAAQGFKEQALDIIKSIKKKFNINLFERRI